MKIEAKILVCYNAPVSIFKVYNGKPFDKNFEKQDLSEVSFSNELEIIKKSLLKNFTNVETYAIGKNIEQTIKDIQQISPDIIYNFVESVEGIASYEYCIAGVFELLGISYTGNLPSTLGNCLNKERTKNILRSFGIKTPQSFIVTKSSRIYRKNFRLKFPIILKLLNEDASIGISEFSVVNDFESLKKQLKFLFETYNQDVIVEEFIDGRELNVAILGNEVLPISEIKFKGLPKNFPRIVTYESKWIEDSVYYKNTESSIPAKLNNATKQRVEEIAIEAFRALNCRDYSRVDIRLSKRNVPYIIEVNPNPYISTVS